jgi:dipeptidyl-peptidase-3
MFSFTDERFADLQLLRYQLTGFEQLTLRQKQYIYALSQATLYGRDITFDQFGQYNLRIRKMLEAVYTAPDIDRTTSDFKALEVYLKRVWFSNGIYHHYGTEKFEPGFSEQWLRSVLKDSVLESVQVDDELLAVIFDPTVQPKRVNKADGEDLLLT